MRTIEIEDGDYLVLEVVSRVTKTPISELVGNLLGENGKPTPNHKTQLTGHDKELGDHLRSQQFLVCRTAVDKFLSILAFVSKKDPKTFATVTVGMGGRSRKYIATTKEELEQSGTSVNPKQIPASPFWVVTNNSTENKKQLIEQALTLLGYGSEAVKAAKEGLG
jgi:negative modulator of initiation of replication